MTKALSISWLLVFALVGSSCSINIDQPTQVTPTPQIDIVSPTSPPLVRPTQPNTASTPSLPTKNLPVTWANLNLTGKLVYINGAVVDNNFKLTIDILDLGTGGVTTIFDAPKYSWINYVSVSPDSKQLIMSYAPPPEDNSPPSQALYTMTLDGSAPPQWLFAPPTKDDQYAQVEWSPDGKYIYYTYFNYQIPDDPNRVYPLFKIFRMKFPDGQPELVAEKAYWPRLSDDSSRLVYVLADPLSTMNKLFVADADGANAREVVISGSWNPNIKDAPIFSPDGQSIIFSAANPPLSDRPNWFEKIMGIQVAKADGNIPSDWWSVPITGGPLTRLTQIQALGLFASISPDNQHIASFSSNGIFAMDPDGSELTFLVPNTSGIPGTVSWIP
jgi:Tol biopolymer transport system component